MKPGPGRIVSLIFDFSKTIVLPFNVKCYIWARLPSHTSILFFAIVLLSLGVFFFSAVNKDFLKPIPHKLPLKISYAYIYFLITTLSSSFTQPSRGSVQGAIDLIVPSAPRAGLEGASQLATAQTKGLRLSACLPVAFLRRVGVCSAQQQSGHRALYI